MDAESLVQIERIVTTAVSGAEGRLRQEFGEKTDALAASFRQEIGEKTEEMAASLQHEFHEGVEEAKRYSGVLYEDMGRKLDLVIEGYEGLREQIRGLDARIEHESLETRALIQLSYRQLQARVETLEQKVQIIEKRLGLSA
jgi:hypothetical protein